MSYKLLVALPIAGLLTPIACGFPTGGLPSGSGGASSSSASGSMPASSSTMAGTPTSTGTGATCDTCETIPTGWTVVHAKAVDPSDTSPCAAGAQRTTYFVGPAGAPSCNPCSCDLPQGAGCTAPKISCSVYVSGCSGLVPYTTTAGDTGCIDIFFVLPMGPTNSSCQISPGSAQMASSWSCTTNGGDQVPASEWGGAYRACAASASAAGCSGTDVCVPPGDTGESVCITQPGATTCPDGWQAQTADAFTGGDDTRACAACSCSASCQGGDYVAYDELSCAGNSQNIDPGGTCTDISGYWASKTGSLRPVLATPQMDACNQATPSGQVTGSGATKICCK